MNNRFRLTLAATLSLLFSAQGCGTPAERSTAQAPVEASSRRPDPFEGRSVYLIQGGITDLTYSNIRRFSVDVLLKPGLDEPEVQAALEDAADQVRRAKPRADAIGVYGRVWDPYGEIEPGAAVAILEYAPNGTWGDAGLPGAMSTSFTLHESYMLLSALVTSEYRGRAVSIESQSGNRVAVSSDAKSRSVENRVGYLRVGERVTLLGRRLYPAVESVTARYLVRSADRDRELVGWVNGRDLGKF